MPEKLQVAATPKSSNNRPVEVEQAEGRRELFGALFLCIVAILIVRSFLFEPFRIPSASMVPTLRIGDHIFVSKYNFGLSIPFTKIELVRWGAPARGDIVVFLFPKDQSLHYIKRVVGVPGDTVELRGKNLIINGAIVGKEPVEDKNLISEITGDDNFTGEIYKESLDNVVHYVKYSKSMLHEFPRNSPPQVIPENHFFVIGDNRDDSYDSRSWGPVPRENIKGKAQMVWMSLDEKGAWNQLTKIRWHRCGILIH